MDKIRNSKPVSIILITVIYILATVLGVFIYVKLPLPFWASLLRVW